MYNCGLIWNGIMSRDAKEQCRVTLSILCYIIFWMHMGDGTKSYKYGCEYYVVQALCVIDRQESYMNY